MANNRKAGEPGRFHKGDRALSAQLFARLTPQQHDRYLALGGARWLREQLDIAEGRQRLTPAPTAHNPFPPVVRDTNPDEDLSAYEQFHGI